MSRLSRPPRAKVRAGILKTAAHEFLTYGYHDARIARIADEAGFTKGALYSNFGSKPELFTEVLMEHLKDTEVTFVPQILNIFSSPATPAEHAQQLSQLIHANSAQLLPWQVLIAQFRLLAISDTEAQASYRKFMEFYVNLACDICEANGLLAKLPAAERRVMVFSFLQIINTVVLEATTMTALPTDYFLTSLSGIFTHLLKGLNNE